MNETLSTITVFIALLLVASGVAMATKWVRVPYTLALVIVGFLISPLHFLPVVHISPELILLIFLPALLFEAAWNLKLEHLRENLVPILLLAVQAELVATQQALSEQMASLGGAPRAIEQQQEERIRHYLISVRKTKLAELLHEGILSEQRHREAGRRRTGV